MNLKTILYLYYSTYLNLNHNKLNYNNEKQIIQIYNIKYLNFVMSIHDNSPSSQHHAIIIYI